MAVIGWLVCFWFGFLGGGGCQDGSRCGDMGGTAGKIAAV